MASLHMTRNVGHVEIECFGAALRACEEILSVHREVRSLRRITRAFMSWHLARHAQSDSDPRTSWYGVLPTQ